MNCASTTHKERVLRALSHSEADRVPFDLGGINNTTMHVEVEKRLCKHLSLPLQESRIGARDQQIVIPCEDLLRYFDVDTRSIYLKECREWEFRDGIYYDQFGIGRRYDNFYYTMCSHPLQKADSIEEIDAYELPDPLSPKRLDGLVEEAKIYHKEYFTILEGLREVLFGLPSWIRGMEKFYMDLLLNPVFADRLLEKILSWELQMLKYILDRLHPYLDMVKIADDLGTQQSLLISPDVYREFIKPRHKRLISFIKNEYGLPVLLHSCGAVRPLIPDFIEIGVDALNPVQITAAGMDRKSLKEEFGSAICFWGGGIDTQKILPKGTKKEIMEDVKEALDIFKQGGGYVFSQIHNIQPDVPVENIVIMYEAFNEYATYER